MRATSFFSLEDGTSTVSWAAWIALRIRVRKSATGSVIDMSLPARLRHAGDVAIVSELAQADAANAELAIHGTRATAAAAARVLTGLVLVRARLLDALRSLGHLFVALFGLGCVGLNRGVRGGLLSLLISPVLILGRGLCRGFWIHLGGRRCGRLGVNVRVAFLRERESERLEQRVALLVGRSRR